MFLARASIAECLTPILRCPSYGRRDFCSATRRVAPGSDMICRSRRARRQGRALMLATAASHFVAAAKQSDGHHARRARRFPLSADGIDAACRWQGDRRRATPPSSLRSVQRRSLISSEVKAKALIASGDRRR